MSEDLPVPKPTFRWSFSQWETYNSCPAKWKYQNVLKLPRKPPGPAAARGLEIHGTVEDYITGKHGVEGLHPAIKQKYIPIFDEFRNHPNGDRGCELKLGFDVEWGVVAPQSKLASVIAVLDAYRFIKPHADSEGVLKIGEWKSGKPKYTHGDQRGLYAMFGMKHWLADRVEATTYYLEDTAPPQRLILASETGYAKLKALWDERASLMIRDQICAPRPSFQCRWCDFRVSEGGPCRFGDSNDYYPRV